MPRAIMISYVFGGTDPSHSLRIGSPKAASDTMMGTASTRQAITPFMKYWDCRFRSSTASKWEYEGRRSADPCVDRLRVKFEVLSATLYGATCATGRMMPMISESSWKDTTPPSEMIDCSPPNCRSSSGVVD